MNNYPKLQVVMLSALLAGCATSREDGAKIPLDSDPRVGEEVQQVCFVRNLDSWQNVDNDRRAVILKMNNRETFKLKLSGSCEPDLAMSRLAVKTRPGSSCFSRGDRVKTDGDLSRGYGSGCTIMSIHKWDAGAVRKTDQNAKQ
jgi:hypothetical protein